MTGKDNRLEIIVLTLIGLPAAVWLGCSLLRIWRMDWHFFSWILPKEIQNH